MAHAYTPGLKAIPCTRLTKNRLLPIPGTVLVEKGKEVDNGPKIQDVKSNHYSFGMPSKPINKYRFIEKFNTLKEMNEYINKNYKNTQAISEEIISDSSKRDIFGDYIVKAEGKELALRQSGDYMLYYYSMPT